MNFREYLELTEQNTVGTHNDGPGGAYVMSYSFGNSDSPAKGMQGNQTGLSGTDMTIPTLNKTSQIVFMDKNKTPIPIMLKDGTKMMFSWDEFKRIKGSDPAPGKTVTVVFQRFPGDKSDEMSQIQDITCH